MNLSMFLKLHKGVKNNKVKMGENYKHFEYMRNKDWIELTITDFHEYSSHNIFLPIPIYDEYVGISEKGKEKYYAVRNSWIKWVFTSFIAIIGIIITLIGVLT